MILAPVLRAVRRLGLVELDVAFEVGLRGVVAMGFWPL